MIKRTILVVDDESVNRRILAKLLADEYTVMQAANGKEALDLLRANSKLISAVLLDIIMPVMDGYEVLKAISEDGELSKIPVIVSSQRQRRSRDKSAVARRAGLYSQAL